MKRKRKRNNISTQARIECFLLALEDLNPNWKTNKN